MRRGDASGAGGMAKNLEASCGFGAPERMRRSFQRLLYAGPQGHREVSFRTEDADELPKTKAPSINFSGTPMKIHFLITAHDSLSQRLWAELTERGYKVSVAIASSEEAMFVEQKPRFDCCSYAQGQDPASNLIETHMPHRSPRNYG
jgi:hypothetical protein